MAQSRPYRLLARFYDLLTAPVPRMNRHARQRILGKILRQVHAACDLGCGSGETALDLARRGLKVYAVDLSPANCRVAREKARRARLRVRVLRADMRRFRLPEAVDLVTCEFAALNHLERKPHLASVFRAVARALRPGGWFAFDLNTPKSLREQTHMTEWMEQPEFKLLMRGRYDKRRRVGTVSFDWFIPRGRLWRHEREAFPHIAWSDREIRRALSQAGFRRVRLFDGMDVRPRMPGAKRGWDAYYLAQRS
ncbi:MAG: class I SAM-dependent methyltransferase [Terriglobales bacterium]